MPRLPRIQIEGAIYYVTSKGLAGQNVFKEEPDYEMYLNLIKKYKGQYKFRLFSYCLAPDQLHLLIETREDATLSEIMHDLNSMYTKYFNSRYGRSGPLFESHWPFSGTSLALSEDPGSTLYWRRPNHHDQ